MFALRTFSRGVEWWGFFFFPFHWWVWVSGALMLSCRIWSQDLTILIYFSFYFLRFYLFTFRGRWREGEREGEKLQCVVASCVPLTGDLVLNPGMCFDWELNWQPFRFAGWCSIHFATPARVHHSHFQNKIYIKEKTVEPYYYSNVFLLFCIRLLERL